MTVEAAFSAVVVDMSVDGRLYSGRSSISYCYTKSKYGAFYSKVYRFKTYINQIYVVSRPHNEYDNKGMHKMKSQYGAFLYKV